MTHELGFEQKKSRSFLLFHCATELKLEGVESHKHNCGLCKNCHNDGYCAQRILTVTWGNPINRAS